MSYSIALDKWAANETTILATICVQSICCILSALCFISRLVQVCKYKRKHSNWQSIPSTMMTVAPLLSMGMNVLYLLTHLWNYIHWFEDENILDCRLWYIILISLLWLARIFLYQFLLLRSLVVFKSTIYQISSSFVFVFLFVHALLNIICTTVLLTDFTPINPFHGFCFRIIGDRAFIALEIWFAADCASAIIVWIVFGLKVWQIRKSYESIIKSERGNRKKKDRKIYRVFRKQMFLGILTVCGSIIIFTLKSFLTVLLGVTFALDATTNNVLLFLFFKENQKYYEFLCCKKVHCCSSLPIISLDKLNSSSSLSSPKSTISTNTHTCKSETAKEIESEIICV